ncbi:MAG TPA: histidine phosphatase family protein [Steroidobacteraceae bacterium]|nr:histidine phosphatase family protein [Steroidobacteraceae bacterium]
MHELILMRHAQAAPATPGAEDFTRPLTAAGRAAAARAARALVAAGARVERVLLSPANRTRETATIAAQEFKLDELLLQAVPELYAAPAAVIRNAIVLHHGGARTLLVVGHNPGISELASQLSAHRAPAHLPTAGLCRLPLSEAGWRQLTQP